MIALTPIQPHPVRDQTVLTWLAENLNESHRIYGYPLTKTVWTVRCANCGAGAAFFPSGLITGIFRLRLLKTCQKKPVWSS